MHLLPQERVQLGYGEQGPDKAFVSPQVPLHLKEDFLRVTYLSTHTVYWYKIYKKSIILGGYGHIGKWIQENKYFMRFFFFF